MNIVDCSGRDKNALSLRVITQEITDAINKGAIPIKYVEAVIKGRNRPETWTEWYPLIEFQINNPDVRL